MGVRRADTLNSVDETANITCLRLVRHTQQQMRSSNPKSWRGRSSQPSNGQPSTACSDGAPRTAEVGRLGCGAAVASPRCSVVAEAADALGRTPRAQVVALRPRAVIEIRLELVLPIGELPEAKIRLRSA